VPRRIFEPRRGEVTGGRRKLHNEELHNLYSSPNIIRTIKTRKMGGACSNACRLMWENQRNETYRRKMSGRRRNL
jgi:hypothetical protein